MSLYVTEFHNAAGSLTGNHVTSSVRRLKELNGVFLSKEAYDRSDLEQVVYEVEMHNVCGNVEGGLYFGVSRISPGKVGDEYFMTKGHFHEKRNRGEYYWGIRGKGMLVLMDENREAYTEDVFPGSLHYIPGHIAHRLVNIGEVTLVVGACWPSDAGHDYDTIQTEGFSIRVMEQDGNPSIMHY